MRDKLEYEGLGPDASGAIMSLKADDNTLEMYNKFDCALHNSWSLRHGKFDKSKKGSEIWWDYKVQQGERTKRSRQNVSAFDLPSFSTANEVEHYGFIERSKADPHKTNLGRELGYEKSYYNAKNHKWYGPAAMPDGKRVGDMNINNEMNMHK